MRSGENRQRVGGFFKLKLTNPYEIETDFITYHKYKHLEGEKFVDGRIFG